MAVPFPLSDGVIQTLRLDGIPTFVAPSAARPNRACLIFRVGAIDERLSQPGITHLVDRCEAMLTWNDGSRTLYGSDGFRLHICPRDWHNGPQIISWLDQHVTKDRLVAMGDRASPDQEVLVRELRYKLKTSHLAVLTTAVWTLVVVGGVAFLGTTAQSGATGTSILLGVLGVRLTVHLYQRLRAPRVRPV